MMASNLAAALSSQGKLEESAAQLERGLVILEEVLGARHPAIAQTLALRQHELRTARTHAERAVASREAAEVTPAQRAEAWFMLARVLWEDPEQQPRAWALAEQAREALATDAASEEQLHEVETWLRRNPRP